MVLAEPYAISLGSRVTACHLNVEGSIATRDVSAFTGSSVPHGMAAQLHTAVTSYQALLCPALHVH